MMHVFKIVSFRVMINVYSGTWKKKVLIKGYFNRTFSGSSSANSDDGFRILNKGVHFP